MLTSLGAAPVEELFPFDDDRIERERLVVRHATAPLAAELPIVREMLNASFVQLGYYTEIDADELA